MTNANAIRAIAVHLSWGNSHAFAELMRIATSVQALETTLSEIVDESRDQTIATHQGIQDGVIVAFPVRMASA